MVAPINFIFSSESATPARSPGRQVTYHLVNLCAADVDGKVLEELLAGGDMGHLWVELDPEDRILLVGNSA